jgi:hypothetical protein
VWQEGNVETQKRKLIADGSIESDPCRGKVITVASCDNNAAVTISSRVSGNTKQECFFGLWS